MRVEFNPFNPQERDMLKAFIELAEHNEAPGGTTPEAHSSVNLPVPSQAEDRSGPNALDFRTFRAHVGTSYRLVRRACEHYSAGDEFTLGELAERSGVPHGSLKSDLMNMGRTAHSLGGSIEDILPSRKGSGGLRHFRLTIELCEDATK